MPVLFPRHGHARRSLTAFAALCLFATACSTTSPRYFARMEAKGRDLIDRQRWQEALDLSQRALAKCDQTDWCAKDARYQGLFHTNLGQAQERLGRKDRALEHYRKAFYAYPLFFTENYFRMLKEAGMYRLLRQEIDVKLASNETAYRNASAVWLSTDPSACGGRWVAGSYTWTLRASGNDPITGKASLSQSGCVVSADIALPQEKGAGGLLHLRGDIRSGVASLLFSSPCTFADKGQISLAKDGFTVSADRAPALEGCFRGPYVMEFARN